jgi:hypothetical protein
MLSGKSFSLQRPYAHTLHQRTRCWSNIEPFSIELAAQHARLHERMLQMRFVNAARKSQISNAGLDR